MINIAYPAPHSVYQRGAEDSAVVPIEIRGPAKSARSRTPEQEGWLDLELSAAGDGWMTSRVTLPVGMHDLELEITTDSEVRATTIHSVGVGDVFVTAGQSNAANSGTPRQQTRSGMVSAFDARTWRPARDPMPVCDGDGGSVWPLLGDLLADELKIPIGFLCLAVGGTSVAQWDPRTPPGPNRLFDRFVANVPSLARHGIRAVLWHQGEADRFTAEEPYYAALTHLIREVKTTLTDAPWLVSIVGNRWVSPDLGRGCRSAQQRIIDEGLALPGPDTDQLDASYRISPRSSHFNDAGLHAMAELWANAILKAPSDPCLKWSDGWLS